MMKQRLWFYQTVQLCPAPTEGEKIWYFNTNMTKLALQLCSVRHSTPDS